MHPVEKNALPRLFERAAPTLTLCSAVFQATSL